MRPKDVKRARNRAYMMLVQGPLAGLFLCVLALPVLIGLPDFGFLDALRFVILMIVISMLAGLISGEVLRSVSSLFWPFTKTVKIPEQGGVWDSELDGPS